MNAKPNRPPVQKDQYSHPRVDDWQTAQDRILHYLRLLGIPPLISLNLALKALNRARQDITDSESPAAHSMKVLKDLLSKCANHNLKNGSLCFETDSGHITGCNELKTFLALRSSGDQHRRLLPMMPPIKRSSMVPDNFSTIAGRYKKWFLRSSGHKTANQPRRRLQRDSGIESKSVARPTWEKTARLRRIFLVFLVIIPTSIATAMMANVMPGQGTMGLEVVILVFYAILFAWISLGFWVFALGFISLLRGVDRFSFHDHPDDPMPETKSKSKTAILIPIYNEKVDRVYAGIAASYSSLLKTGRGSQFDFFILSDSNDPDKWVEEEVEWLKLCEIMEGFNHIFYRRRHINIKKKNGNIADFCRRWGQRYDYMVIFDADSIMSGDTLVKMVDIMDSHPQVGILQTLPLNINQETLLARVQQFVSRMYAPIYTAGMHFFQLGEAHYWGHNAIIRVKPFMAHCTLPRLSGPPPFGGDILSHDFVEAALMRKAGWEVWVAHHLRGSYEEPPPNLIAELKRDRRWCTGNMQHMRLMVGKGWFPAYRMLFLSGVMSYLSGFLWFLFLCVSTAVAIFQAVGKLEYFPSNPSLFPQWPVWNRELAIILIFSTAIILFLPKLLACVWMLVKGGQTRLFGGPVKLFMSIVIEALLSVFLAPIRMLFHSRFVVMTLLGWKAGWGSQQREEDQTNWLQALNYHRNDVLLGIIWGMVVFLFNPGFLVWLAPILVALILSIPLSVWTSRKESGRLFRRLGLFLTPEEVDPPLELKRLKEYQQHFLTDDNVCHPGFIRAITDPCVNTFRLSLLGNKKKKGSPNIEIRRNRLRKKALHTGPKGLSLEEKREILSDPASMSVLHRWVWELPERELTQKWGISIT